MPSLSLSRRLRGPGWPDAPSLRGFATVPCTAASSRIRLRRERFPALSVCQRLLIPSPVTPKQRELLERRLRRLREEHSNRLLVEESTALEKIEPSRPATVGPAYEQFLHLTAAALKDHCDQVRREVASFVDQALLGLVASQIDEILQVAGKELNQNLYLERFDMFEGAIQRRFGRIGSQFDPTAVRLDLLRARQHAGTANNVSRFLASLRDDLDLRVLAQPPMATDPASMRAEESSASATTLRELLLDLYRTAVPPAIGVDRRSFRVRHHMNLNAIDEMVRCDAIRESQGFYVPSLLSLSEQKSAPEVGQLFDDCNSVLAALRNRYLENQAELIASDDLASRAGLTSDRFSRALTYLQESVSVLAGSRGERDHCLQHVLPAERVLLLKDMNGVLAELGRYRDLRTTLTALPLEAGQASLPSAAHQSEEDRPWLQLLPDEIRALLAEIFAARHAGLRALVLMGVRAAIDMTCNHLIGDLGGFDLKLRELRSSGRITEGQQQALHAVVQLGHASAHRGHVPGADDVDDVLDILERLLKAQYVDQYTTQRIVQGTPQRQ